MSQQYGEQRVPNLAPYQAPIACIYYLIISILDDLLKLCLCGSSTVGKTSICQQLARNSFEEELPSTSTLLAMFN
jgi:GTPase SAR1 family protein